MKKNLWMLLLSVAVLYVLPMLFRPLLSSAEFRYAEIAREMLEQKDFVSPKLLGLRYFDAMPMSSWLTAANIFLFGANNFSLRLLSLLSVLGTAALLFLWCKNHLRSLETSITAAFLYLGGSAVCFLGTFAGPEAFFSFCCTAAWVCFFQGIESGTFRNRALLLLCSGVAAGCGFLTGGIPAFVLFFPAMLLYLVWNKDWRHLYHLLLPLLAALLFIAPWAVAVHKAEPDFWYCYAAYKNTLPSTQTALRLLPLFLLAGLFPALPVVLTGITGTAPESWKETFSSSEFRFSFGLLLVSLIIPVYPSANTTAHFLVIFVPAALIGALLLDKVPAEKAQTRLHQLTVGNAVIFMIIGTLALLAGLFYLLWGTGFIPALPLKIAVWAPFMTTLALGLVISGTLFFIHRKEKFPEPAAFFSLYAVAIFIAVCFMPGYTASHRMPEYELLSIASDLSGEEMRRPRIITTAELMYPAAWCFKDSTVQVLGTPGAMAYGHNYAVAHGERPFALTGNEFSTLLKDPGRQESIFFIICKNDSEKLALDLPQGKVFTTTGDLCGFYFPAPEQQKGKK